MYDYTELCTHYRSQLRPVFEMLKFKRLVLRKEEWLNFVSQTEQSIILSPEQYLFEFEKKQATQTAIHCVFEEFLEEVLPNNHD